VRPIGLFCHLIGMCRTQVIGRDPALAAAAKEIGRNVSSIQGDVSNLGDLDRLFAQIKRAKGKLDIVFANAGVARYARFGEITEDLYDFDLQH
jgi:NAD(P)-dependent dehydrogenase (short-subunit alcohol dehydrogenase family)